MGFSTGTEGRPSKRSKGISDEEKYKEDA